MLEWAPEDEVNDEGRAGVLKVLGVAQEVIWFVFVGMPWLLILVAFATVGSPGPRRRNSVRGARARTS